MSLGEALGEALSGGARGIASALHRCLGGMQKNLLIQTVAVSTIALMLLLCGTVRLCGENVSRLLDAMGQDVEMIVYLSDSVTPARATQIQEVLAKLPGVSYVRPVSQQEAYERLRRSLGDQGDLLEGVEEGLLPASLEVGFRHGVSDILRVHPVYEKLRTTEGVEDVELMGDWVRRLLQAKLLLRRVGWTVGILIALSCLYIIAATIRLGIHARRDEIEVLKLVGATNLHVEAPFLLEGLLQGLIGSCLALLLLYGLYRVTLPEARSLLRDILGDAPLSFLPPGEVAAAIGLGGLWGLFGSAMAVGKHLRV